MRPILAVLCAGDSRETSRLPARAIIDVVALEPADQSLVTVKLGSQVMEISRQDLLNKAVPVLPQ